MANTFGVNDFKVADAAMRRYFESVYKTTYTGVADGSGMQTRKDALAALSEIKQSGFFYSLEKVISPLGDAARDAALADKKAGVPLNTGLSKAIGTYETKSMELIDVVDNNNKVGGTRGNPARTEKSHRAYLVQARGTAAPSSHENDSQSKQLATSGKLDFISSANAAVPITGANTLPGTNIHYGDSINIAAQHARHNASLVLSSLYSERTQRRYFDPAQVKAYLNDIPVQARYSAADLAELHAKERVAREMGNQSEANVVQAVISTLTLENQFSDLRKQGKNKFTVFETNADLGKFHRNALKKAGTYTATSGLGSDVTGEVASATADTVADTSTPTGDAAPETATSTPAAKAKGSKWPAISKQVQADLEALNLPTGQPRGVNPRGDVAKLDGVRGPATSNSIDAFRASKPEYKDLSEEALFVELSKAAEAKRAAGKTAAVETPAAPALTVDSTAVAAEKPGDKLAAILKAEAAKLTGDSTPINGRDSEKLKIWIAAQSFIGSEPSPTEIDNKILEASVTQLNDELSKAGVNDDKKSAILRSVTLEGGKVQIPVLRNIERLANLPVDGFVDINSTGLMKAGSASLVEIVKAINNGSLSVVATAVAPSATPSVASRDSNQVGG